MKYYRLPSGELVSTQKDVRDAGFKLNEAPIEEVPNIDKEKLRVYINSLVKKSPERELPDEKPQDVPVRERSATAILSRLDAPKDVDVDKVVETIMNAAGYPLKRYAGAVAQAFLGLSK